MGQALRLAGDSLLGVMNKNEKLINVYSSEEMQQLMLDYPQSILIYNQSPQAIEIIDKIEYSDGQQCIEVFQDTEGVFGLRAYRQIGKIQTPVVLQLSD